MQKLLALVAAVLFTLGVVAGCGHNGGAATAQVGKTPVQTDKTSAAIVVEEGGHYTDKDHVALYIHKFGRLPGNYITKNEAKKLGWKEEGTLDKVAPGKSIGGDHFGNFEHQVPDKQGRKWKECDIDYRKGNRGAKRLVFSSDGLIYYSPSHYRDFIKLY
jgi:guanyl-specific ribonuclease Sa